MEESIAPTRRVALHRVAIVALATRGGENPDFARLAHHAEAAGDAAGVLGRAPAPPNGRRSRGRTARPRHSTNGRFTPLRTFR